MKRIITFSVFVLLTAGIVVLFVFANLKQKEVVCEKFEIIIQYDGAPELISKSSIKRIITSSGIRIKGQPVSTIPVRKLQKLLNGNPYIKKVTISMTINGIVKANILQRNPLVRVIDNEFNQCLIDHDGNIMPVNPECPVRLVLANGYIGNIKEAKKTYSGLKNEKRTSEGDYHRYRESKSIISEANKLPSALKSIYKIAIALKSDTLTSALIEQIYITNNGEIELFPKIGEQSILLGDTVSLNAKLNKLRIFYTQGMNNVASNDYKVINLKYNNQVVCSK